MGRVAAEKFAGRVDPATRDRDHLWALWTRAMVSVLNDLHRKERRQARRGARVELSLEPAAREAPDERLEVLADVLRELARRDQELGEDKALLVALRYFEGLTWEEVGSTLGSSVRRARDEWDVTRAWLRRELRRRGVELG